jgi:hypothetical protein
MKEITYDEVSKYLRYEPDTGKLFWLVRSVNDFRNQHYCDIWNTKNAGKEAGTTFKNGKTSYIKISIHKIRYKAHRLAWLLFHKKLSNNHVIDHEDHNGLNNRIVNLKEKTQQDNKKNASKRNDNTSGYTGVTWHPQNKKWVAQVGINGRVIYLGSYKNIQDAALVRRIFNEQNNFHKNHGV